MINPDCPLCDLHPACVEHRQATPEMQAAHGDENVRAIAANYSRYPTLETTAWLRIALLARAVGPEHIREFGEPVSHEGFDAIVKVVEAAQRLRNAANLDYLRGAVLEAVTEAVISARGPAVAREHCIQVDDNAPSRQFDVVGVGSEVEAYDCKFSADGLKDFYTAIHEVRWLPTQTSAGLPIRSAYVSMCPDQVQKKLAMLMAPNSAKMCRSPPTPGGTSMSSDAKTVAVLAEAMQVLQDSAVRLRDSAGPDVSPGTGESLSPGAAAIDECLTDAKAGSVRFDEVELQFVRDIIDASASARSADDLALVLEVIPSVVERAHIRSLRRQIEARQRNWRPGDVAIRSGLAQGLVVLVSDEDADGTVLVVSGDGVDTDARGRDMVLDAEESNLPFDIRIDLTAVERIAVTELESWVGDVSRHADAIAAAALTPGLEEQARSLVEQIVGEAAEPVPVAVIAAALTEKLAIGPEDNWGGTGSFRAFVAGLVSSAFVVTWHGPGWFAARRVRLVAETLDRLAASLRGDWVPVGTLGARSRVGRTWEGSRGDIDYWMRPVEEPDGSVRLEILVTRERLPVPRAKIELEIGERPVSQAYTANDGRAELLLPLTAGGPATEFAVFITLEEQHRPQDVEEDRPDS